MVVDETAAGTADAAAEFRRLVAMLIRYAGSLHSGEVVRSDG